MNRLSVQKDAINQSGIIDTENTPPVSTKSSASTRKPPPALTSPHGEAHVQPLSPRPINVITSATSPVVSFHAETETSNLQVAPTSTTSVSSSVHSLSHSHYSTSQSQSATAARYKDQIFQLSLEIQSLKQRLSLTSSTSKNELLDLLSEKDSVIANKSKQISALNDKFTKITKAVNSMEREMSTLRKKKKDAEDECKKANRYLGIREKEVNVLVTRCAAQEEKLNEQKGSRVLERELNSMKKQNQKQMEDHGREIKGLMRDLQQIGNEKQKQAEKIVSLEEKNKTLQGEIDTMKSDIQEKRDKINNLYDEIKELHESKERESTESIAMRKNLQDVKHELFERETEIDEMRTSFRHDMNKMRKQLDDQRKEDEESLVELSSVKDTEIDSLRREIQSHTVKIEVANDELKQWKRKHEFIEKEYNELQKYHQEELSQITKKEAVAIENERLSLEAQLNEKKQVIDELDDMNRRLKDENESHSMQMSKLKEKLGFLENEIRGMTEKEMDNIESLNEKIDTICKLEKELRQLKEVSIIICCIMIRVHDTEIAPYLTKRINTFFLLLSC